MALVAQGAHHLGSEHIIENSDNGLAVTAIIAGDRAAFHVPAGPFLDSFEICREFVHLAPSPWLPLTLQLLRRRWGSGAVQQRCADYAGCPRNRAFCPAGIVKKLPLRKTADRMVRSAQAYSSSIIGPGA